jgi:hypothetical protein
MPGSRRRKRIRSSRAWPLEGRVCDRQRTCARESGTGTGCKQRADDQDRQRAPGTLGNALRRLGTGFTRLAFGLHLGLLEALQGLVVGLLVVVGDLLRFLARLAGTRHDDVHQRLLVRSIQCLTGALGDT